MLYSDLFFLLCEVTGALTVCMVISVQKAHDKGSLVKRKKANFKKLVLVWVPPPFFFSFYSEDENCPIWLNYSHLPPLESRSLWSENWLQNLKYEIQFLYIFQISGFAYLCSRNSHLTEFLIRKQSFGNSKSSTANDNFLQKSLTRFNNSYTELLLLLASFKHLPLTDVCIFISIVQYKHRKEWSVESDLRNEM